MNRSGISQVVFFFLYALIQVLLLKNLVVFNTAFCFLYVAFILLLPVELNILLLMLLGFVMGFTIDVFYDSLGMHASALVVISYLRNYWLGVITPQGGYDTSTFPTVAANGIQWFLVYALPLVFIHHAVLFFAEAWGFDHFWFTMLKVINSTLFTLVVILILQYLNPQRRRS